MASKKIMSFVFPAIITLIIVLIMSVIPAYAQYSSSPLTISPGPDLRITLVNQEPDPVSPGSTVKERIRIENYGAKDINNVKIEILPGYGYEIVDTPVRNIGTMKGAQKGVTAFIESFNIKIKPETPEGLLKIKIRQTSDNQEFPIDFEFDVNVQTTTDALVISSISTTPSELEPGKEGKLSFIIRNSADSLLSDVKVSLNLTGAIFSVIGSTNEKVVSFINPKQEESVDFNIIVNPEASLGIYQVPVTITFRNSAGTSFTKNIIAGIVINSEPSYLLNLESTDVYTSKTKGKVTIAVSNTGNGVMKFTELDLVPTDEYDVISASKVYLGNIDSDDTQSNTYEIYVKKSVNYKVPLRVNIKFKDKFNKEYTKEYLLNLQLLKSSEASKLGVTKKASITTIIFSFMVVVLLLVFWITMIIDVLRNQLPREKKIIWFIVVVLGMVLGSAIYYFVARRKPKK